MPRIMSARPERRNRPSDPWRPPEPTDAPVTEDARKAGSAVPWDTRTHRARAVSWDARAHRASGIRGVRPAPAVRGLGRLAGLVEGLLQVRVQSLLRDPEAASELHGLQLATVDQPVDRHPRNPQGLGDLRDGPELHPGAADR